MKKRIILIFLTLITMLSLSFAFNEDNFNYLNLYLDEQSETNKVSFELKYPDDSNYLFEMIIYHNGEKLEEICKKNIQLDTGTIFSKITCEIKKYGDGEYIFEGYFYDKDNNLLKKTINKEFIFSNLNYNMQFTVKDDKTTIIIDVEGDKPLIVENFIPKEVIERLTKENQDSLIETNIPYVILDEDPLIAWHIEEPPARINYTINKKVSIEDQQNFRLEIKDDNAFKGLKYTIYAIIFIILGFLIKPIFSKNKKQSKN